MRTQYLAVLFVLLSLGGLHCGAAPVTAEINGTVLMPDGSPAAGASIETLYPKDAGKAVADERGNYVLKLPAGCYSVIARSGEFVLEEGCTIEITGDGKVIGSPLLKLSPAAVVVGRVTDKTTGEPIAGAQVKLRDRMETQTGPDGIYRFDGVPRVMQTIMATKEGFTRPIIHFSAVGQPFVQVDMSLKPEGILRGTVTNEKGEPVVGASVGSQIWYFNNERAVTDAQGQYTLTGLDPDEKTPIWVTADHYEWIMDAAVVFPAAKHEDVMDFKLIADKKDFRDIAGRIMEVSGRPVKDARVSFGWSENEVDHKSAKTDADGRYILRDVSADENVIAVMAKGFAPAFKRVQEKVGLPQVDLVLLPGHSVEGKFVDEDGKPLEGVRVRPNIASPEVTRPGMSWPYMWDSNEAVSDKAGHFRLEDLPARGVSIMGGLSGYSEINMGDMPLEVDRTDHVIVLKRPGHVAGTVLDSKTGAPITKFRVEIDTYPGGTEVNSPDGVFDISARGSDAGDTVAVTVEASGYTKKTAASALVLPRTVHDHGSLVMKLTASKPFNGLLTEAGTGKPIAGARVTVLDTEPDSAIMLYSVSEYSKPLSLTTDSAGAFRLDSAPTRFGSVILEKQGYGTTVVRNIDLFKPLKAALYRGGTIKGIALDPSGSPTRANVMLELKEQAYATVYVGRADTGEDGVFSFKDLAPGRYTIHETSGGETVRMLFKALGPVENYTVDWNRPGESTLLVNVTEAGKPASDVHLLLYPVDQPWYAALGKTGRDGASTLTVDKAARYHVWARKGEFETPEMVEAKRWVDLKPGRNQVDLQLPTGRVTGHVVFADGNKPAASVGVRALKRQRDEDEYLQIFYYSLHTEPGWRDQKGVTTDYAGRFEFTGLSEGEWTFVVYPGEENSSTIGCPSIKLGKDEVKEDVELVIPKLGSAEVLLSDAKAGRPSGYPVCISEAGLAAYPEWNRFTRRSMGPPSWVTGPNGGALFRNLVPGKYRVISCDEGSFLPAGTIDVRPGEVTTAKFALKTSSKIIFRLIETEGTAVPGQFWVGYKITRASDGKPVLEDYHGPCLGGMAQLTGDFPRQGSIAVPPGEYDLDLVLRGRGSSCSPDSNDNLWAGKLRVKVAQGKYTILDIPVKVR